jgi:large conductance mechanosensitive channel
MSMLKEFKEFALRGNVVDLAVGVIIGAAFGKIVSSLVEDVIMPPIGFVMGGEDFSNLFIRLNSKTAGITSLAEAKKLGPVIAYGQFLTVALHFLIIAFCIFLMIKGMNILSKKSMLAPAPAPAPPEPTKEEKLLTEIRDLLKTRF